MTYKSRFQNEDIDELFEAVLNLETKEECYMFFEDLCTVNEIHAMTQRWQVAKLLAGKKTYSEIEGITQAATATISRINKCFLYGAGGYQMILEKMNKKLK